MTTNATAVETIAPYLPALIGLLGVIVGSGIAAIKELFFVNLSRRKAGVYAAIRVISMLEEYAQKCIDVVDDNGEPDGPNHPDELSPAVMLPEALNFPKDIDFTSLPGKLTYRALALPNLARDTDRYIQLSSEDASPPDYKEIFDARQIGYAMLGLEAMRLASALRKKFNLPVKDRLVWNAEWEPERFLLDRLGDERRGSR